jgi:hypothetical protein
MATLTDAQKIEKYRAQANDKSIPQDVRNQYLDKANEMERKAYEDTKKLAKGGMVKKGAAKAPAKKMAMPKGKPAGVAILITPAKKLAKGGMAKKKC